MSNNPTDSSRSEGPGLLDRLIDELELSVRTASCLRVAEVTYVGELARMTELDLFALPRFNKTCLRELTERLAALGLELAMPLPGWAPPPS